MQWSEAFPYSGPSKAISEPWGDSALFSVRKRHEYGWNILLENCTEIDHLLTTKNAIFWGREPHTANYSQRFLSSKILFTVNIVVIGSYETSVLTRTTHATSQRTAFFRVRTVKISDPTLFNLVRFEVFTAVTMKNGVFWDVTPCGSCKNRRFGGTWRLLHQGEKNWRTRNNTSCN
jgi:hypothetical protein